MNPILPVCCSSPAFEALSSHKNAMEEVESLLLAAVAIAQHAMPEARVDDVQQQLDDIAHTISSQVHGVQTQGKFAHMHEHLFVDLGFVGNSRDYYDPGNSMLPAVLATRKGLPIALSLVYKLVADRLGLSCWGVGLPGHFVTGINLNGKTTFIDAFAGGSILSVEEAKARLATQFGSKLEWSDRLVEPVSNRYWITRLLQNLLMAYTRTGEFQHVSAVLEMELVLWPEETRLQRDMAIVLARIGKGDLASQWLDLYLHNNPDDPQSNDLRQILHKTI